MRRVAGLDGEQWVLKVIQLSNRYKVHKKSPFKTLSRACVDKYDLFCRIGYLQRITKAYFFKFIILLLFPLWGGDKEVISNF